MFKKSFFRGPFEKQHGNWAQTRLAYLLITVKAIELEEISVSDIQKP